jgi:hypothetical protein
MVIQGDSVTRSMMEVGLIVIDGTVGTDAVMMIVMLRVEARRDETEVRESQSARWVVQRAH